MQKIESKKSLNSKVKTFKIPLVEGSDSESKGATTPRMVEDSDVVYHNIVASKKYTPLT